MFFRVHRKLNIIGKDSIFEKNRFENWFYRKMGVFPVGTGLSSIKTSLSVLKKNQALLIYPEGTRSFDPDDALALHDGASMIAIKAGVPILPVVVNRAPRPFRLAKIKIGEPISTEQFQDRRLEKHEVSDFSKHVAGIMSGMLDGFEKHPRKKKWDKLPIDNARAIVIKEDKDKGTQEILLMHRTKPGHNNGREYFVTPGGHTESGETAKEAVAREVKEETGIDVKPIRALYKNFFRNGNKTEVQATFLCRYLGGDIEINKDSEEYQEGYSESLGLDGKPKGTFKPMWIALERLFEKSFELKSPRLKKQLAKDIRKKGTRLTRNTKLLK